jgi:hypothetical protein
MLLQFESKEIKDILKEVIYEELKNNIVDYVKTVKIEYVIKAIENVIKQEVKDNDQLLIQIVREEVKKILETKVNDYKY